MIAGGCGDDDFDYVRAWLISRGQAVFEGALADPDSLATIVIDDEEGWEGWMSPTVSVVHARTGAYDFAAPPDPNRVPPREPHGEPWEEADLADRFPRLTAQYD